jgi:hypothetical protein
MISKENKDNIIPLRSLGWTWKDISVSINSTCAAV